MDCSYLWQTFVNEVRLVLVKQNRPFIVAFTLKLIGHLIASYFVIQIMSLNACRFAFRTSNELITPKKRTSIVANCLFCKVLRDFFQLNQVTDIGLVLVFAYKGTFGGSRSLTVATL